MGQRVGQRLVIGIGDDQHLFAVRVLHGHRNDGGIALSNGLQLAEVQGGGCSFLQEVHRIPLSLVVVLSFVRSFI